ncbi:MAG: acetolactate synthase small subunit [Gammaproteobacteria bacterium]|jgi:acetolactate synthase-1/3 small subunit|nr:acetolactate synthase small subunit [Gammaproteobacteria bacterium]
MRHVISILLQNEAGALSRVASLFSTRGYNIESLSVAPTEDPQVSRLTLVSIGSDQVINQITHQLFKLVDVVNIADMTMGDHIERELMLIKLTIPDDASLRIVTDLANKQDVRVLDDALANYTLELTGSSGHLDEFIDRVIEHAQIMAVVRSGPLSVARGQQVLSAAS